MKPAAVEQDLFVAPDILYAEVAVHEPVFTLYTYKVPASLRGVAVGSIVELPFGRQRSRGCVLRLMHDLPPELDSVKIREIADVVTPGFFVAPDILQLAMWMSQYYIAPPGDCCSCVSFIGLNDIAAQTVRRFKLSETGYEVLHGAPGVRLGKKQAAALEALCCGDEALTITDIAAASGATLATVKSLLARGWVHEFIHEVERKDDYHHAAAHTALQEPLALSAEQQMAFAQIDRALTSGTGGTFLLYGVTGSGKTEIYLQAIQTALDDGGEAIVLVPEISLTPQTVDRFRRRFGSVVGVYHSRLTLGQKFDLWKNVISGHTKIMVGARSALFTPFPNLRVIVVDEEHESTYKQESSPRYNARDVAIKRAVDLNAVCILGSATPSVETFHKAKSGKFHLLELAERIDSKPLPPVTVVDMTDEVREEGNPEFISNQLYRAMCDALERNEQVLLFLNRRGFFNFVVCLQCHEAVKCKHCDVALTHHRVTNKLMCHYCGREYLVPKQCPSCESTELNMIGLGTERLEDIVSQVFSSARVMRLDLDTTKKRNAFLQAWKVLEAGEVDIILGTQMIAKGLHLENVTVVGLPLADGAFYQPDFRATERAFALMTQVAGRAGRGSKPGRVFLQTYVPHHYAVIYAQAHDYLGFYNKEIRVREVLRFPPFYRLFAILGTGKNEEQTSDMVRRFTDLLKSFAYPYGSRVTILGPSPAPLSKINDLYRWRVLMRSKEQSLMRTVLHKALAEFQQVKGRSHVQLIVDVDPVDLL